jgi:hypothetical protein
MFGVIIIYLKIRIVTGSVSAGVYPQKAHVKTLTTNNTAGKSRKMTLDIGSRNGRMISGLPIRKVFVNA